MKTNQRIFCIRLFLTAFTACFYWACTKEAAPVTTVPLSLQNRDLTLEEIISVYGHYGDATSARSRSGARLPLDVIPNWNNAYAYTKAPMPVIMTSVDTSTLYQDHRYGGNLAFYKDSLGTIQSLLIVWQADSLSVYLPGQAPLDTSSYFNGMLMSIDAQDTIRIITRIEAGRVISAREGASELVFETLLKNNPYVKTVKAAWEASEKAAKIGKLLHKVEALYTSIGQQAIERAWGILNKMDMKFWEVGGFSEIFEVCR